MSSKKKPYLGVALMMAFALFMVICDSIAKTLSQSNPVINIVWYRYLFHAITLALILGGYFLKNNYTEKIGNYGMQLLRGLVLIFSSLLFFQSLSVMPLAEALSLMYVFPIVAVWLSVIFLRERLTALQHLLVITGFTGVILVLGPTSLEFFSPGFNALIAGCMMGLYLFFTKLMAVQSTPLTSSFLAGVIGILTIPLLPSYEWIQLSRVDLLLSALMGGFAALGHFCLFLSMQVARASFVSPFAFIEILFATAISYFWFNDILSPLSIFGIILIVTCGALFAASQKNHNQIS